MKLECKRQGTHSWPFLQAQRKVTEKGKRPWEGRSRDLNHSSRKQPHNFLINNFVSGLSNYLEHSQCLSNYRNMEDNEVNFLEGAGTHLP